MGSTFMLTGPAFFKKRSLIIVFDSLLINHFCAVSVSGQRVSDPHF
jgi:hypothetical protein